MTSFRVAARYILANGHYKVDEGKVRARLRAVNDPDLQEESDRQHGGHFEARYELVPIARIDLPHVWHAGRIDAVRKALASGVALPPVELTEEGSKLHLTDGIHRTNGSIEYGFTVVPAVISCWVANPEARRPVEPEKHQLPIRAWVHIHKPHHEGSESFKFGYVAEQLGFVVERGGVKRWKYQIALVHRDSDWPEFIDMTDTDFEPTHAPSWGRGPEKPLM